MIPEKIARINELAKKQKAGTLTAAEKEEQAALRMGTAVPWLAI